MGNIVLLDDLTINKIAAGEVIERPASVVKELIENSIDAGATSVTAEIKNGGISYIRITDNGKGFLPDDMEIAFERHATSKIRSAKDLESVKSMGFRGEALASIAAIARVELTSRTADSDIGYRIVVEGGKIINKEETGCPKGTTIVVENLFFNTPVRYKFLKKDFTELGYVEDAVTRIALVNPGVAMKLVSLGKTIVQTTGNGNLKDTVYSIYGKDVAENMINVDYKLEDMSVKGCIGKAEIAKATRINQLFFVNGRYIKDKTLTSAADQAYKGIAPPGKYGFLILNLEIDPHQIDVNVHPAKMEIRFQGESKIFKLVYHAIKESFIQGEQMKDTSETIKKNREEEEDILELIKEGYNKKFNEEELERQREFIYSTPEELDAKNPEESSDKSKKNDDFPVNNENLIEEIYNAKLHEDYEKYKIEDTADELKSDDDIISNKLLNIDGEVEVKEEKKDFSENVIDKEIDESINFKNELKAEIKNEDSDVSKELDNSFKEMYRKTFGIAPVENKPEQNNNNITGRVVSDVALENANDITTFNSGSIFSKVKYKFIGFIFTDYIVIEINDMMYILDQHAVNERIIYEKIKRDKDKDSQVMLLPDIIELTPKQMDIAMENIGLFKNAGFDVEEFGENTVRLTGVPGICIDLDTKELFLEILDEINTVARIARDEVEDKFAATVAKKAAKKAKIALSFEEADELMQKLLNMENPFVSPQGKTIAIKLSQAEIEKKFSN
ncbi:MAG: DNA mismatch repair endonuclease MutL [Clostridia bacterium]|nr:DNA mismatch repair endonuclease MutL [Clostridia bacterium]